MEQTLTPDCTETHNECRHWERRLARDERSSRTSGGGSCAPGNREWYRNTLWWWDSSQAWAMRREVDPGGANIHNRSNPKEKMKGEARCNGICQEFVRNRLYPGIYVKCL